ncbi:MAG: sugar transferase [Candidatus Aminicenantes bacterium]|nr:MAG: sugar transferase [Candidatus Aminicenantes bacterium]
MRKIVSILALLLADIVSLVLAFHLAYFIRVKIVQDLFNVSNPWFFPIEHFYKMYYLLLVFILIFSYEKLYSYHRRYNFAAEFVFIARGLFISVILIALLVYLSRTYEIFTRTIPILMMLTGMIIVPLFRFIVKKLLIALGCYTKHTTVIGKTGETAQVIPTLEELEANGYKITNVIDMDTNTDQETIAREPIKKVDTVIIVSKGIEKERLNSLINRWENHVKEIKIVSDSSYLKTIGVETEYVEELLVMRMANNLLSPFNRFLKRLFDLVVSFMATILLLPVFMVMAVIIKIDSRGPVLFIQERFRKEGKKFKLLKFRTMYVDADAKLKEYLLQHPHLQEEWDQYKKLKTFDPRVTRVGKFLRRFSLDESPQILNVLKGDMSIVGPRPYLPRERKEIQQSAAIIFRVKSGLTGLWQIKGRNELDFETRLKLDEFYVRNWSFLLDIMIILKTFGAVLKGKGAY